MSNSSQLAASVRLLILDVDGVMTDGKLYFSAASDTMKTFHTQDGQGIKLLRNSGVEVGIITGRQSEIVARRATGFGVAVCNASAIVREHADYVTKASGGSGAVREVCELIMQAQNTLDAQLAPYLSA